MQGFKGFVFTSKNPVRQLGVGFNLSSGSGSGGFGSHGESFPPASNHHAERCLEAAALRKYYWTIDDCPVSGASNTRSEGSQFCCSGGARKQINIIYYDKE